MFLKFFRSTGPGVIFFIIVILIVFWISPVTNPEPDSQSLSVLKPMPLYAVLKSLFGVHYTAGSVFSFILMSLMMFMLVSFNTTVFFINERTFLPALIYLLITSVFPGLKILNPVLPSTILFMLALFRIMDSYRKPGVVSNFFDAGFLISTASLFYGGMLWFAVLAFIGLVLLGTISFRDILLAIIGIITPYLLLAGTCYVFGYDLKMLLSDIITNLLGVTVEYEYSRLTIIALILTGLIMIISIGYLVMTIDSKKIKSRKTYYLLLWIMLISLGLFFGSKAVSVEMIWIFAIPASYLLTHYLISSKKKIFPEIIFSVYFLIILIIQVLKIL